MPRACLLVTLNPSIGNTFYVRDFRPGAVNRLVEPVTRWADGKGLISAVADRRAFNRCHSFFPSGGVVGRELCQMLKAQDVSFSTLTITSSTRRTFSVNASHTTEGLQETHLLEAGPRLSTRERVDIFLDVVRLAAQYPVVAFCGSLPEDLFGHVAELVTVLRSADKIIFVDTSGSGLSEFLVAGVDIVKINESEFREALGEEVSVSSVEGALKRFRLSELIVTRGARAPICAASGGATYELRFTPQKTKSTVGCGDCFSAGLLSCFDLPRVDRLMHGCAFGIGNTTARVPGEIDFAYALGQLAAIHCVEI